MNKNTLPFITSLLALLFWVTNLLVNGSPNLPIFTIFGIALLLATTLLLGRKTKGEREIEKKGPLKAEVLDPPEISADFSVDPQEESPRILVIDDEPTNVLLLKKQLEKENFHVVTALNGFEGLEIVEEEPPHLIIVDLMMPEMTGIEFCVQVREYFDSVTLPIMILTAKNLLDDMIEGLNSGANDYLTKPFQQPELIARVRGLLKIQELGLLREELAKRKLTEQELSRTKSRLAQLIEHSLNGIFLLDEKFNISFINQVAAQSLGDHKNNLILRNFSELFETDEGNLSNLGYEERQLTVISNQKEVQVSFIPIENEKGIAFAGMISETMVIKAGAFFKVNQQQPKLSSMEKLETLCQDVIHLAAKEGDSVLNCLQELEKNLDEVSEDIKHQRDREHLVEIMLATLKAWETITGKTKVELAEESGIWRASLDGGVYRTRTLDKYLSYDLLPAKPRWKDVIKTAEFVLAEKSNCEEGLESLEKALKNFRPWKPLEVVH